MKKKIPFVVLETLEKYVNLEGDQFNILPSKNFLLKIIDNDLESDFYFNVEEFKIEKELKLLIDLKPRNKSTTNNSRTWIEINKLDSVFYSWVNLLKDYGEINSFYDDPILKSFEDDYYSEFEIIEEDADIKPLKPTQIVLLDKYLEDVENSIENFATDNNIVEIQEIKKDVINLRENLTSKPKAWIIRSLSKIWAKLTKQGTKFLKEFVSETRKQAIKQGVKFMVEQGTDLLN
ncbi:hypothetical protein [Cyclobacterium qasimii]|uniref:Uncharacterized protein n=2 Tax=Cyclobacterium qasimii TaxID=1350429 RepID=S7VCT0_9BACT|nr:hypothetical protein [Cyclobacterium qasimii]EPR68060.1 hypothetical protein ADICYQ_3132 [Cyclobacterium qasimii M12-11B]GEO21858.1 hypothetical protein CQA01_23920 [Cyclobacterium qasimii]